MNFKPFLFFFFMSSLFGLSYPYRDITKPPVKLDEDIIVLHYSGGRCGGTLIYNVMKYLFEDNETDCFGDIKARVIKRHTLESLKKDKEYYENKRFIITTNQREPLNIIASERNVRLNSQTLVDTMPALKDSFLKVEKILTFRYELFENDQFNYIFNLIENKLDISIQMEHKNKIRDSFSKATMKKLSSKYRRFSRYDHVTGIHGKHINNSDWRRDLSLKEALTIYNRTYDLRLKWGYADIDVEKEWQAFRANK